MLLEQRTTMDRYETEGNRASPWKLFTVSTVITTLAATTNIFPTFLSLSHNLFTLLNSKQNQSSNFDYTLTMPLTQAQIDDANGFYTPQKLATSAGKGATGLRHAIDNLAPVALFPPGGPAPPPLPVVVAQHGNQVLSLQECLNSPDRFPDPLTQPQANAAVVAFDAQACPWDPHETWGDKKDFVTHQLYEICTVELPYNIRTHTVLTNKGASRPEKCLTDYRVGLAATIIMRGVMGYTPMARNLKRLIDFKESVHFSDREVYAGFVRPVVFFFCQVMDFSGTVRPERIMAIDVGRFERTINERAKFGVWSIGYLQNKEAQQNPADRLTYADNKICSGLILEYARMASLVCASFNYNHNKLHLLDVEKDDLAEKTPLTPIVHNMIVGNIEDAM